MQRANVTGPQVTFEYPEAAAAAVEQELIPLRKHLANSRYDSPAPAAARFWRITWSLIFVGCRCGASFSGGRQEVRLTHALRSDLCTPH